MMCLGWYNRPTCRARDQVQVVPPQDQCPDINWFWLAAAAIVGVSLVKK